MTAIFASVVLSAGCGAPVTPPTVPVPAPVETKAPEPARELEPWEKITAQEIDAITYEDCDDDFGVTFPFLPDLERVGDDEQRKKSFADWREKLENWDCNGELKTEQKVRNFISLMALVDVMQMEFEGETPLVLFERMKKEIPREQLLKAAAYCALKPEAGTVLDKCPDVGIDDGSSEERVRDRVSTYAKKVLGRLLGKLPPKEPEPGKK